MRFAASCMGRYTVSGSGADWLCKVIYMNEISRKQIGRIGLTMAINYFTINGYTVSLPINDTQWYDLIVEKTVLLKLCSVKLHRP